MFNKKILFLIFIFFLAVSFAVFAYHRAKIYSTSRLQYSLEKSIKGQVKFNSARFSFWEGIKINKLSIKNAGGIDNLKIVANRIRGESSWIGIFFGGLPVKNIELKDVTVFLQTENLNRVNFPELLYKNDWLQSEFSFFRTGFPDFAVHNVDFIFSNVSGRIDNYTLQKAQFLTKKQGRWLIYLGNLQLQRGNLAGKFILDRRKEKLLSDNLIFNFWRVDEINNYIGDNYDINIPPYFDYISGRLEEFSWQTDEIELKGNFILDRPGFVENCRHDRPDKIKLQGNLEYRTADNFLSVKVDSPSVSGEDIQAKFSFETVLDSAGVSSGYFSGQEIFVRQILSLIGVCSDRMNIGANFAGQLVGLKINFNSRGDRVEIVGHGKSGKIMVDVDHKKINIDPLHLVFTGGNFYMPSANFTAGEISGDIRARKEDLARIGEEGVNVNLRTETELQNLNNWLNFPHLFPASWSPSGRGELRLEFPSFPSTNRFSGLFKSSLLEVLGFQFKKLRAVFSGGPDSLLIKNFRSSLLGGWGGGSLEMERNPENFNLWSRYRRVKLARLLNNLNLPVIARGPVTLKTVLSGSPQKIEKIGGSFKLESSGISLSKPLLAEYWREINKIYREVFGLSDERRLLTEEVVEFDRLRAEFKLTGNNLEIEKLEMSNDSLFIRVTGHYNSDEFRGKIYIHPLEEYVRQVVDPSDRELIDEGLPPLEFSGELSELKFNFSKFKEEIKKLVAPDDS
ncbi:MAG: hypothetical protein ACQEP7_01335 [bacterium]